jgi:hypothetical protein
MARLRKIVADLTLDRECFRMSFAESSFANVSRTMYGRLPRGKDVCLVFGIWSVAAMYAASGERSLDRAP